MAAVGRTLPRKPKDRIRVHNLMTTTVVKILVMMMVMVLISEYVYYVYTCKKASTK